MSAKRLLRIAREHNVTQIVIGKPLGSRWTSFLKRDPLRWLMRNSGNIDIHMIPAEESARPRHEPIEERFARAPWRDFGFAVGIAAGVTALCLAIFDYTGYWAVALFYLLAVVLAATRLRRWPTLFLAALSALALGFSVHSAALHFLHQPFSRLHDVRRVFRYRHCHRTSRDPIARTRTSRAPPRATRDCLVSLDACTRRPVAIWIEALPKVFALIKESFQSDAAVWLPDENGLAHHRASTFMPSSKDESVAVWAFQKKQAAGKSTDTLPDAESLHVPLVTGDGAEGVLTVRLANPPTLEQRELLDAFAAQLALFVNKERALEESRAAQVARQSERLQKALFDSVSHELKTPLAAMSVALQQPQPDCAELQQAVQSSHPHSRSFTRCDAPGIRSASTDPRMVRSRRARARSGRRLGTQGKGCTNQRSPKICRTISVDSAPDSASPDCACFQTRPLYGRSNQPIEVSVARDDSTWSFLVADRGPGLAPGEENKVFEKFYRGPRTRPGGLGLGLSIARQLVEAHGGEIIAQNREGGGARFSIRLPLANRCDCRAKRRHETGRAHH